MRSLRATLAVGALAAMIVGPMACKGDAPEPTPAPPANRGAETKAPAVSPVSPGASKNGPGPSEAAAVPAQKKATTQSPAGLAAVGVPAAATEPRPVVTLAPLTGPVLPAEIFAVAATPSLARLVPTFGTWRLDGSAEPTDPVADAVETIRATFELQGATWLDTARPVRIAVPDVKRFRDGFVIVLPVIGEAEAVKKGFGPKLTLAQGHDGVARADRREVFIDFVDGHVILTSHNDLYDTVKTFVNGPLMGWTPTSAIAMETNVSNVKRVFASELTVGRGLVQALGKQLGKRTGVPIQAETLQGFVGAGFDFIEGTSRMGLAVDVQDDVARVALGIEGEPGSTLYATIEDLAAGKPSLADATPPNAWFALASHIATTIADLDRDQLITQVTQPAPRGPGFTQAQAERLANLLQQAVKVHDGDSVFTIAQDGPLPLGLQIVGTVRDAKAAQTVYDGLLSLAFEQFLAQAKARAGADGAAIDNAGIKTFKDAVRFANAAAKPMGVQLQIVDEQRGDVTVEAVAITIDWDKSGLERMDPRIATLRALIGARVELAMAFGKRAAITFGPTAITRAVTLAGGGGQGGEPHLRSAQSQGFLTLVLRTGAALRAFASIPQLASSAAAIAKMSATEALVIVAHSDARRLSISTQLPLPLVRQLVSLR